MGGVETSAGVQGAPPGRRWGRLSGASNEGLMRRVRHKRVVAVLAVAAALSTLLTFAREGDRGPRAGANEPARGSDLETLSPPRLDTPPAAPSAAAPPGDSVIEPPPDTFTGPAAPAPPPPSALQQRFSDVIPEGGTWAVVIGINDYPGSRYDLRASVNDASDVNEALARMGLPGSRRLLLRDGQATAEVIRTAVEWLVAHASPEATVVFFYAGHVRKVQGQEAIVAADGRLVRDSELGEQFGRLRARRAWIGIAACYGGGFTEMMGPGRILTAAASADRLAYENLNFGRSYMVEYMVRRGWLGQQSGITVEEAFEYARRELSADYPGRVPFQIDSVPGLLDLRPLGAATPTPPRPQQPPPSPSPPPPPPPRDGSEDSARPPEEDEEESDDSCSTLTVGVVNCGGG